jgi:hypothetical protein
MFDFRDLFQWERFITPTIIRVFYWLATGLSVLWGLWALVNGFRSLSVSPMGGLALIVASIIGTFAGVVFSRVATEFILIVFRISEHLGAIRNRAEA